MSFYVEQGLGTDEQVLIEILSSRSYEVSVEVFLIFGQYLYGAHKGM